MSLKLSYTFEMQYVYKIKKIKKKKHERNTITYEEDMMMSQGPRAYL